LANRMRVIRGLESDIQRIWPGYMSPINRYPFESSHSPWLNIQDG
jgi:hypothetical protein